MIVYVLSEVKQLGEADPKYGITYWASANETLTPLMFNSMGHVGPGQKITAEEQETKTSKKGNDYLRLKKVRVVQAEPQTAETPAQSPVEPQAATPAANIVMQLDRIEKELIKVRQEGLATRNDVLKLLGEDAPLTPAEEELITGSEPVNLDDIPF